MSSGSIATIVLLLTGLIGFVLSNRSLKKDGHRKVEELFQHLQQIGVRSSVLEEGADKGKIRRKNSWGQRTVGTIEIKDRNIDLVNIVGVAHQYGVYYHLDFLVKRASLIGGKKHKQTKMKRKRSSAIQGKIIDIEWNGDDLLAQKLNCDYSLRDKMLQADLKAFKRGITIFPEPEYDYSRIRAAYFLPAPDLFEVVNIIAKHIKSGY